MKQVIYDGFQGRARGRGPAGEGRHPRGRAVRRRRPPRRDGAGLHDGPAPSRRAARTSSTSSTATTSPPTSRRSDPDLRQGPGALQPRGRRRPEPTAGARLQAAVRLPARQRSARFHVRAARAAAARRSSTGVRGDKKALRPGGAARPDGAVDRPSCRRPGVEPDVWKIEGLDRREDCEQGRRGRARGGRDRVGCIVLGRGEDDRKVREWLATAAAVPGFIGFAVGRTTFWDALTDWRGRAVHPARRPSPRSPAATGSGSTSSRRPPLATEPVPRRSMHGKRPRVNT